MQISHRQLIFGAHRLAASDPAAATPYVLAGERIYALGHSDGVIAPIGVEHLIGEMGGVWAHPCKVADGLTISLRDADDADLPASSASFTERLSEVCWEWQSGALGVTRRDRVLPSAAGYVLEVQIDNQGAVAARGALVVMAQLAFRGAWFGGLSAGDARIELLAGGPAHVAIGDGPWVAVAAGRPLVA